MLKLNAGFSRKVGEPNYGSRGASVNVELEVESNLIGDSGALLARIRSLFDLARQSVDEELSSTQGGNGQTPTGTQSAGRFSNNQPGDRAPVRYATASQVRAIRAICNRQSLDAVQRASRRFQVNDLEELTLREASSLIDELKATSSSGGNGGAR